MPTEADFFNTKWALTIWFAVITKLTYVRNNPLGVVDPLGLDDCYQDSSGVWQCPGTSVDVNGGAQPPIDIGMGWGYYYDSVGATGGGVGGSSCYYALANPCGTPPAANNGFPVNRTFQRTFQCSSSASGVMNALESNFSSFANNPASGSFSTFSIFTPGPVSPGGQIGINVGVQAGGHTIGYSDVSVTVQSATSSQLAFQSDPGHVLYPATVSFSASDAGNGSITFTTSVNATTTACGEQLNSICLADGRERPALGTIF